MRFALAAASLVLLFASSLATAQQTKKAPGPSENPPALAPGSATSYVACYFGSASYWKWGLTPANDWFSMSGKWVTAPITNTQKFQTATSDSTIVDACKQAKSYYNIKEEIYAACAAESDIGNSYPIVANNVQMYPFRC